MENVAILWLGKYVNIFGVIMKMIFSFVCFCIGYALFANEPSITVPKGWSCVKDTSQLPQKIVVVYVGPSKNQFTPSINIACENTDLSCEKYIELAKKYHESTGDARCKFMGSIATQAGSASILQIDRSTQWGNIRFMQAILIRSNVAYVVTTTCLQEEFAALSSQFLRSIQSFTIKSS